MVQVRSPDIKFSQHNVFTFGGSSKSWWKSFSLGLTASRILWLTENEGWFIPGGQISRWPSNLNGKTKDDIQIWTSTQEAIKKIIECTYAGLRVSKRVRSIWITLTMAESFFSLSKMFDSNCSTVSCLKRKTNSKIQYYSINMPETRAQL